MYISDDYKSNLEKLPILNNYDFMVSQIWHLKHLFHNDIAFIKDINHTLVAYTTPFWNEFISNKNSPSNKINEIFNLADDEYNNILLQEQQIINTGMHQDSIFLHKNVTGVSNYVLRKRPLINPANNNCLGIQINMTRFTPGVFRKYLSNIILGHTRKKIVLNDTQLTQQQQQIIFCLLLGFHSRKEIANLLSNITQTEHNEIKIKNSLQALYNKFECNTTTQLMDLIIDSEIKMEWPENLPTGQFPFNK